MTKEEFAKIMMDCTYGDEINRDLEKIAKENDLVVIFGASDDLTEFRGAISDEAGVYNVKTHEFIKTKRGYEIYNIRFDAAELIDSGWTPLKIVFTVTAEWCPQGFEGSWRIKSSLPYASFNVMENDELYCEGIVIDLKDIN